jgi:hypothetical protein
VPHRYCNSGATPVRQIKLLNFLLVNQGKIVSKSECFDYLYSDLPDGGPDSWTENIDVFVLRLRQKGWPIETVWGRGLIIRWQRQPGEIPELAPEPKPRSRRFGELYGALAVP